jgi:MFS family permease
MVVAVLGIGLPEIRASLELSEIGAGTLFTAMFVVAAPASLSAGRLSDNLGRRRVLVAGGLALGAGFGLVSTVQSYGAAVAVLALAGLGYGFITASVLSLVSDLLPLRRGFGMGLLSGTYGLGSVSGPIVAAAIIQRFGWRGATATVGCIAGAIALIQWVRIREPARAPTAPSVAGARKPGVLNRNMVLLAVAQFFGGAVFWITSSWTPTFLRTTVNLTINEAGMVMAAWGATPILGAMVLGTLSDRVGRKRIILLGAFPGVLVVLAVYGWLVHPLALAAGICLLGLCKSPVPSLVVALAQDSAAGGRVGAASGLIMSMHYVAALTTPVAMAQLITWLDSMSLAMLLGSAIAFTVFGVLITSVRERA